MAPLAEVYCSLIIRASQFNKATKCARAEEGRLSLLKLPAVDPEHKKAKAKDVKRTGAAVLAAELEMKRGLIRLQCIHNF